MKIIIKFLYPLAFLLAIGVNLQRLRAQSKPDPPTTRREDTKELIHGIEIDDPYRWLEDQNSKATRAWIDAENDYTDSYLGKFGFRKVIADRLGQLLRVDWAGIPVERNEVYFYRKKGANDEQAILYTKKGSNGEERVFLDPNPLSKDHTVSAGFMDFSHDGSLAAYYLRHGGEDEVAVRIKETSTMHDIPDSLPRAMTEGISFKKDNSGFYYTVLRPLVGRHVYYHAMGTETSEDVEIFGKGYGPEVGLDASVSPDGQYLLIGVYHGWAQNDLYIQDLAGNGPMRAVVKDVDATFEAGFAGNRMVILTDWKAPNKRIVVADPNDPSPDKWKEIVPAGSIPIEALSRVGGKLFVQYLKNVASQIKIFSIDGNPSGEISLPGLGSATVPFGRWENNEAFYSFTSFTVPRTIYRYDVSKANATLWNRPEIPFDADKFETKQVWFTSKDGTKVPMFLVQRKGLNWDGKRPTLLYGYGGFNISMTPGFSETCVLWVEHDGVYAAANLRGGGEFGEAWHKAGMRASKQNVFDDFYAAAEWLVNNNVTNPSKLAIEGGSNGGLLVGAALTQRPELYKAVVCEYPLLDMVRYHKFLQGPQWVPEYGSAEDSIQFNTLYVYSPYHHVTSGIKYPSTLFITGDADTRVAPLHARKMTALLQSVAGPDRPILLHYETEGGHSGGEPTSKRIVSEALTLSYLFWQLDIPVSER